MLMIEVMNAHSIVLRPVVSSEQLKVLRLLVDQAEPLIIDGRILYIDGRILYEAWDRLQTARPAR